MRTLSREEYEKLYGKTGVDAFTAPAPEQPLEKGLVGRVTDVVKNAGENVYKAVSGQGEYKNSNPLVRGVGATFEAFNAVPQTALAASPAPVRKVSEKVGEIAGTGFEKLTSLIGSNPDLQEWVMNNPDATDKIMEVARAAKGAGAIAGIILSAQGTANTLQATADTAKSLTSKVAANSKDAFGTLRPTAADIANERSAKIRSGFEEQNSRLKTAEKAFNENTIVRSVEGAKETITPIDTLSKYELVPEVEKGTLNLGDYKTGSGALGKVKEVVRSLDDEIDTKLVNSGQRVPIDELQNAAIESVKANPDLMRAGTVNQTINKIKSRFEDYRMSYGDDIDIAEINNIRKVANRDWNPDTQDTSRVVGDVSRDYIYDVTPDGEIRKLLINQGELLAAKKYLEKINGSKVTGGRMGNYAMRTAGAVIGSTVENAPIVGPTLGMLGGEAAARAMQQGQFKSLWTELRSYIAKD